METDVSHRQSDMCRRPAGRGPEPAYMVDFSRRPLLGIYVSGIFQSTYLSCGHYFGTCMRPMDRLRLIVLS